MNIREVRKELNTLGFFSMLKLAASAVICGSDAVQNEAMLENGLRNGSRLINLFPTDEKSVIWIAPIDIEAFWTEEHENGCRHFFRTKSGKDFEVTEDSWLRIFNGSEYRRSSDTSN